ncbi:MAG: FecR domain-containing protein [Ignavibacteria bacterium]|nr:FecR domain-containing protein [Ignavibacteria bacterium]
MINGKIQNTDLCAETEQLIDEYLEGMISLKDKEMMDEHLAVCSRCADYLKETSALVKDINSLTADEVIVSSKKKDEIWNKVESGINKDKYKILNSEKNSRTETENSENFFSRYKYVLSGIAAILALAFIVFGVKNMKLTNDRMSEQNTFGLASYWKVSNLQGNSLIGDAAMSSNDSIKEGQFIQTNNISIAELLIADIGKIIIEPNTKVVFVKSSDGNNRINVEYGTINADMNKNGKTFFVEMPSAVANDDKGKYTLTIDSAGDGLVFVRSGKVDVESSNRIAVVPAGNIVLTKKNLGVGTPFNENSSPKFRNALFSYDFGKCNDACVNTLLNAAKISDAVTLVNLMPNVEKEYSDKVYAKLANFVTPPPNIHSDSIAFFDEKNLNDWIDKIQMEVQVNVEKSLKNVEKSLENLKDIENIDPQTIQGLEDFAKNWKFEIKTSPEGTYEWKEDSVAFDKEEFRKDMEEMKKDLKENSEINKDQLKQNMDQLKEDLREMNKDLKENLNFNSEELKKEIEKAHEEIRKALKETEKIHSNDSAKYRYKFKIDHKDGFENDEPVEKPEMPESPEKLPEESK